MSATLNYRIVTAPEGTLHVGTPSSFIQAMTRAFNAAPPWSVGADDIPILRGMAAAWGNDRQERVNPFEQLIGLIEREDGSTCEIEVWPTY